MGQAHVDPELPAWHVLKDEASTMYVSPRQVTWKVVVDCGTASISHVPLVTPDPLQPEFGALAVHELPPLLPPLPPLLPGGEVEEPPPVTMTPPSCPVLVLLLALTPRDPVVALAGAPLLEPPLPAPPLLDDVNAGLFVACPWATKLPWELVHPCWNGHTPGKIQWTGADPPLSPPPPPWTP